MVPLTVDGLPQVSGLPPGTMAGRPILTCRSRASAASLRDWSPSSCSAPPSSCCAATARRPPSTACTARRS